MTVAERPAGRRGHCQHQNSRASGGRRPAGPSRVHRASRMPQSTAPRAPAWGVVRHLRHLRLLRRRPSGHMPAPRQMPGRTGEVTRVSSLTSWERNEMKKRQTCPVITTCVWMKAMNATLTSFSPRLYGRRAIPEALDRQFKTPLYFNSPFLTPYIQTTFR